MEKLNKPEGNRFTYFQIGLIGSLLLVLLAFEWRSPVRSMKLQEPIQIIDNETILNTAPRPPEPPPDKPKVNYLTKIELVPDTKNTDNYEVPDAQDTETNYEVSWMEIEPDTSGQSIQDLHIIVQEMPSFMGGEKARLAYMKRSVKYPKEAVLNNVEGRVYISFIIERDGGISNVSLLRGIGYGCDEEALRVISNMPAWIPGRQGGQTVRVLYNTDIRFILAI